MSPRKTRNAKAKEILEIMKDKGTAVISPEHLATALEIAMDVNGACGDDLDESILSSVREEIAEARKKGAVPRRLLGSTHVSYGDDASEEEEELRQLRAKLKRKREIEETKRQLEAMEKMNGSDIYRSTATGFLSNGRQSQHANNNNMVNDISELLRRALAQPQRPKINYEDVRAHLDPYTGDDEVAIRTWLTNFEDIIKNIMHGSDEDCLLFGRRLLDGTAKLFVQNKMFSTWQNMKCALIDEFDKPVRPSDVYRQLRMRRRQHDEPTHRYVATMEKIARQCPYIAETEIVQAIILGMQDISGQLHVLSSAMTLCDLKQRIPLYEGYRHAAEARRRNDQRMRRTGGEQSSKQNNQRDTKTVEKTKCYRCGEPGHFANMCKLPPSFNCFGCGQAGHHIKNCANKKVAVINESDMKAPASTDSNDFDDEDIEEIQKVSVNFLVSNGKFLQATDTNILIDSGSPANFVRRSFVPNGLLNTNSLHATPYSGIGNKQLFAFGIVKCQINFRNYINTINCYVLPDDLLPTDILVGRTFMKAFGIKLGFIRHAAKLLIEKFKLLFNDFQNSLRIKNKKNDVQQESNVFDLEKIPSNLRRVCTKDVRIYEQRLLGISIACNKSFIDACSNVLKKSECKDGCCFKDTANENIVEYNVGKSDVISDLNTKLEEIKSELENLEQIRTSSRLILHGLNDDCTENVVEKPNYGLNAENMIESTHSMGKYICYISYDEVDGERDCECILCESEYCETGDMNDTVYMLNEMKECDANIGVSFGSQSVDICEKIIRESYLEAEKPTILPQMNKFKIRLNSDIPVSQRPRRLSYHDKQIVDKIVQELIEEGIVRPSDSEYASPIVLVKRKSGEPRLCVDYRQLNRITLKENHPIPLINDCLEFLGGNECFSILDLKNGFHQVEVDIDSIKYTAFVTPSGQFEYLKMPFGVKNGSSVFQRFITSIFRDMIDAKELIIYIDDILIATKTVDENLRILKKVFDRLIQYGLQIKLKKCHLIQSQIDYLGYVADARGIRPNDSHIVAIKNFPKPTNLKKLQACLGTFSYFRRFVAGFSRIAHPLTELLKKDAKFVFSPECEIAFEKLKSELMKAPILAIYQPDRETELHTDASSHGFAGVLMQKQKDNKFHPVGYYSRKTSDAERKYHSFELETLAIMYALERFQTELKGIPFRIVTDCSALQMTLSKKNINDRIARWALELENYDYTVVHRKGVNMGHVDGLSRNINDNVAVITASEIDNNLQATQSRDPKIIELRNKLEQGTVDSFKLFNGLVYREMRNDHMSLYVPSEMENNVIQLIHEKIGHLGINKCYDQIRFHYWFPSMKEKIKKFIENCLRCIMHSEPPRLARTLHMIPKKPVPWDTLHLDFYGPLPNITSKKKFILGITDAFTKYTKLYAVNATSSKEVCMSLSKYFEYYGRPKRIITDRQSSLTSADFKAFMNNNNIELINVATGAPQANGQIERVNRILTPMLGKLSEVRNQSDWSKVLNQVEYALNNSVSSATKSTPSMLLFGIMQRGPIVDKLSEYIDEQVNHSVTNIESLRALADQSIQTMQKKNKEYFDGKYAPARTFGVGDFVVIKNIDTSIGTNKKLIAKYKGPYVIHKVLDNDRYVVTDIENHQVSQIPYSGVLEATRMKHWIR